MHNIYIIDTQMDETVVLNEVDYLTDNHVIIWIPYLIYYVKNLLLYWGGYPDNYLLQLPNLGRIPL